jgi:hypothetical protein
MDSHKIKAWFRLMASLEKLRAGDIESLTLYSESLTRQSAGERLRGEIPFDCPL